MVGEVLTMGSAKGSEKQPFEFYVVQASNNTASPRNLLFVVVFPTDFRWIVFLGKLLSVAGSPRFSDFSLDFFGESGQRSAHAVSQIATQFAPHPVAQRMARQLGTRPRAAPPRAGERQLTVVRI